MGKGTIIGIIVGFGALILGFVLEHGDVMSLFLLSPAIIVLGGTAGALMVSYSVSDVAKIPKLIKTAASTPKQTLQETLSTIHELSVRIKKEGLLVLDQVVREEEFAKKNDPLLVKGLTMLMDGMDKNVFRDILENDVYIDDQIKKREIALFESAGGYSPTLGIIGTVLGLIQVLANMSTPEELAKSIAVAFVATLYGVCFANLLYLPIASKLSLRLKMEKIEKDMIIDGLLAMNDFENPTAIKERLTPYLRLQATGKSAKKDDSTKAEVKEVSPGHEQTSRR